MPVLLATPGGAPAGFSFGGVPGFPGFPGFGGGRPGLAPGIPGQSDSTTPPGGGGGQTGGQTGGGSGGTEELPPLAPVPLSGSGLFLILALVAMMVTVARRRWSGRLSVGN